MSVRSHYLKQSIPSRANIMVCAIIFCLLAICTARGVGQDFVITSPSGAVEGKGQTAVTLTEAGKAKVNINFDLTLNGLSVGSVQGVGVGGGGGGGGEGGGGVNAITPPGEVKGPDPSGPPVPVEDVSPEQEGLEAHNYYRSYHDAPPMTLNDEMNQAAKKYATKIANSGRFQHSKKGNRPGQGENLVMSCSSRKTPRVTQLVKNWYDEVCDPGYPFGSVSHVSGAGHFTQVVWIDSVELGIGAATIERNGMKCTYLVGRYKPQGNFNTGNDDYNKNVKEGKMFDKAAYCGGQVSQFDAPLVKLGDEEHNSTQSAGFEFNDQEIKMQPVWKHSFLKLAKKGKIHFKRRHRSKN